MSGIEGLAGGAVLPIAPGTGMEGGGARTDDAARFEAAMAGPPGAPSGEAPAPTPPTDEIRPVDGIAAADGATSPGDRILQGLERMSQGYNQTMGDVRAALDGVRPGEAMTSADLLRLQFAMTQVSVQQDVTGKVVGKATQSLDQFLKNG